MKTEVANLIQIVNPTGDDLIVESQAQSTSCEYDEHGQRIRTTLTDGSYMLTRYDAFGRVIAESTQIAPSVTAVWSDVENSFMDDATSAPIETKLYEYDAQGRLAAVELPAVADPQNGGMLTRPRYEYEYDARGNQTVIRDPRDRETRFTYDEDGIEGTADDSAVTPGEWTETFEYDEMGRQVLHISFEGVHTRTVYDQATGRMLRQEFFADDTAYNGNTPGEVWTYLYDAFGREVEVIQDGDGSLATTGDQRAHRHTYDDRGRLTVVENAEGTIQYAYDDLGRKTAMKVFPAGADVLVDQPERVTSYTYDALGRLASVTEDQDPSSSSDTPLETGYKYDLRGNLDETHLPNGVIEDYVYDELNRLDTLTHYAPDATPEDLSDNDRLAEFDYTVRADGKRTAVTETYWLDENEDGTPEPQITEIDWTYDELGRLTSESIDHFDSQFSQTEWFEYDLVGNRLRKELDSDFDGTVDEAIAYLYDANDRLKTVERDANNDSLVDETTTYGYDGTQQTSKTVFDNSAQANISQAAFTYDLQGRLHTATITTFTGGTESRIERTTYDYDASGIRVSALHEIDTDANGTWGTTTRTEYLVDHHNFTGYQQVIKETIYDDQGQIVKTIEYNFGHDEISQTVTQFDAAGQVTAKHTEIFGHDGHGSVKVLYDAAAAILQVFTYEAYGQMLAVHNAIAAVVTTGALTSLQYSGEQFDSRIGQQYLRARYYDPNSGRFNRLDPFAGNSQDPQSFHKYLYTHGNPVMGVDPSGLLLSGLVANIGARLNVANLKIAATYTGRQSAIAGIQTAVEFSIIRILNTFVFSDDPIKFDTLRSLGTNFTTNVITGGIGNFYLRNLADALAGATIDRFYGDNFGFSLAINVAAAFGGEIGFEIIRKLSKKFSLPRPGTVLDNLGGQFEETVKNTFRRKIINEGERLFDETGRLIGEIDFETEEAIAEVGLSLRGKLPQLHKLAEVAKERAKRLDVIYGPDTSHVALEAMQESLRKKWGNHGRRALWVT